MRWRALPLDGELLLFDRRDGTNLLLSGDETKHLRREAPRMLQVSLTNACNKTCDFCYRPLDAKSTWSWDEVLDLARFCDRWGVLEIAFGGGEPTLFPRFAELLKAIWTETKICPSFTTNGLRLTSDFLRAIRGYYGQLQLSVYDEDDTRGIIARLVEARARFGLNYLVTPARVRTLEADVLSYVHAGVRDMLFLSYKGTDDSKHLSARECRAFDESLAKLHRMLKGRASLKVDVCWGSRLSLTPRLLDQPDCEANVDFLSLTSDKKVLSCSFASGGIPFSSLDEMRAIYTSLRGERVVADAAGCARLPSFGRPRRHLPLQTSTRP